MKAYITKTGQNIFDVCITLYGSVEGLLDLLISNTSMEVEEYGPEELRGKPLTVNTVLSRGVKLYYHEDIDINSSVLDFLKSSNIVIANGEKSFDVSETTNSEVKILIVQSGISSLIKIELVSGELTIDWGDLQKKTVIRPEDGLVDAYHLFRSNSKHNIKISGTFICKLIDLNECNGLVYPTDEIITAELKYNTHYTYLTELFKITSA